MAWWDTCKNGGCTGYNPSPDGKGYGPGGYRSDYSVPLPYGTPVESPVYGVVLPQHTSGGGYYSAYGQQSFGGEVDMATIVPDYRISSGNRYGSIYQPIVVGVIHLDSAAVQPGQLVKPGDIIGTSGGQKTGGNWPSGGSSTGPHIGLQVHKIGSWDALLDPSVMIGPLQQGNLISNYPTLDQLGALGISATNAPADLGNTTGAQTSGQCAPWDIACLMKQGVPFFIRVAKILAGASILFLATLITFLPEVGAGAAIAAGVPEAAPAVSQALGGRRRIPQTRTGAAVQAWSLFAHHGQQRQAHGRANVAAVQAGQPAPFPASPGAPNQPPYNPPVPKGAKAVPVPKAAKAAPVPKGAKAGKAGAAPSPVTPTTSPPAPPSSGGGGAGPAAPTAPAPPLRAAPQTVPLPRPGRFGRTPKPKVQKAPPTGIGPTIQPAPLNARPRRKRPAPGEPFAVERAKPTRTLPRLTKAQKGFLDAPPVQPMVPSTGGAAPTEPPEEESRVARFFKRRPKQPGDTGPLKPGKSKKAKGAMPPPIVPAPEPEPPKRASITRPLKRPYTKPAIIERLPALPFDEALRLARERAKSGESGLRWFQEKGSSLDDLMRDLREKK